MCQPTPSVPIEPNRCLSSALQLPRASRQISDWLFKNRRNNFHTDDFLPPHAFNNSIILQIHQFFADEKAEEQSDPIFVLLVPVDIVDGISVGYSLTLGKLLNPRLHPFEQPKMQIEKRLGRFAFDSVKRHIVGVLHDITDTSSALYTVDCFRGNRRQRCFIAIPNNDYTFEMPPTLVLGITTKHEIKVSTVKKRTPPRMSETTSFAGGGEGPWSGLDVRQLHPNVLYDLIPGEYNTTRLMDENAQLGLQKTTPTWKTFSTQTPSKKQKSLFDMRTLQGPAATKSSHSISDCLEDLENALEGKFIGPQVYRYMRKDGSFKCSTEKDLHSSVSLADNSMHERLKKMAVEAYYAVALPL